MVIGVGVFKYVSMKKQTGLNAKAAAGAAGSAQYQRRVTSTVNYTRPSFGSSEIKKSQMQSDARLGTVAVNGSLSQELSCGGHQWPLESIVRQAVQAGYNSGALTTVAAAALADTRFATLTRAAGDWRASGKFKIGDVVDITGFASPATANNCRAVITALTDLVMTVCAVVKGTVFVTKAAGDSVTVTLAGAKAYVPRSGHTRDYWSYEEWHADLTESEVFKDVVFTAANFAMNPNGMVTLELPVMGLDMDTAQAEYFTDPADEPSGAVLSSAVGLLIIDGVLYGTVTAFSSNINGNYTVPGGVAFSEVDPDIFPGVITSGGQMSVLIENMELRDKFKGETYGQVTLVLHDASDPTSPNFFAKHWPKAKFTSHTKDDGQAGLTASVGVIALEKTDGGADLASLSTIVSLQDGDFFAA